MTSRWWASPAPRPRRRAGSRRSGPTSPSRRPPPRRLGHRGVPHRPRRRSLDPWPDPDVVRRRRALFAAIDGGRGVGLRAQRQGKRPRLGRPPVAAGQLADRPQPDREGCSSGSATTFDPPELADLTEWEMKLLGFFYRRGLTSRPDRRADVPRRRPSRTASPASSLARPRRARRRRCSPASSCADSVVPGCGGWVVMRPGRRDSHLGDVMLTSRDG